MECLICVKQSLPSVVPRCKGPNIGTAAKALPFRPRQLFASKFPLCQSVGEVQTNRNCFRIALMVQSNHEFHFVVDFTWVARYLNRARVLKAVVRLDEKHGVRRLLVTEFHSMFCKRSDGAPQGHTSAIGFPFMKFKVEPRVKCCGQEGGL